MCDSQCTAPTSCPRGIPCHTISSASQCPVPHNVPWLALLSHTLQSTETYYHRKNRSIFGILLQGLHKLYQ